MLKGIGYLGVGITITTAIEPSIVLFLIFMIGIFKSKIKK